jgi:hypothetical protein
MLVAAVIYFGVCFPDSVPVLRLIDDAAVGMCVATGNLNLISSLRTWEILCDKPIYEVSSQGVSGSVDLSSLKSPSRAQIGHQCQWLQCSSQSVSEPNGYIHA